VPSWMVLGWITLYRQPSEVARYPSLKKLTCYHVDLSGCFRFYDSVTERIEDDSRTGAGAALLGLSLEHDLSMR
jgi:hypothetical protein